jgi:hypothetical protein
MDIKIIAIYCLCDDLLPALRHAEDGQRQMSDAEVMTTAFIAMLYCSGNFERARHLLYAHGYMPTMLSRSRYNRRLHQITDLFVTFFARLGQVWKALNHESLYVIDSFPVAACDNYRIPRARLYRHAAFRGAQASKKRYFYGLKLHLLITKEGHPVEFFLTPGSFADVTALFTFPFDLPPDVVVYGDRAYNAYMLEDLLQEAAHIQLLPLRKKGSTRPLAPARQFLQHYYRKRIETVGSSLTRLLPKSLHAVTARGFELKVALFVIAYSVHCALPFA